MTRRVSLVMPAYDAQATIGAALTSVLAQTLPDVEVVVVDDGSTDRTAAIAREVAPDAVLLRQDNLGVGAARAAGIAAASGDLVAFCDADDFLFDHHLEALVAAWRSGGERAIATANAYWWLPGGIEPRRQRHRGRFPRPAEQRLAILRSNFVSTMALFPRRLVEEIGPVDAGLRQGEDWEFWIRAVYAGYRVVHQPRPLALYRWSTDGLSADTESFHAVEHEILRRVAARDDLSPQERQVVEERLAAPSPRALVSAGEAALHAGRYAEAADLLGRAARLVPTEPPLVRKARVLRAAPGLVGPLLRQRERRRAGRMGMDDRHAR